jgi:hypothetical protein
VGLGADAHSLISLFGITGHSLSCIQSEASKLIPSPRMHFSLLPHSPEGKKAMK